MKINKKNVSVKNGYSETETKTKSFNFDTSISDKAIGNNNLFIFADKKSVINKARGFCFTFRDTEKSVIEIDKDVNNFDEFITILFHELGHYIFLSDDKYCFNNCYGKDNNKLLEQTEEQANLFAEHMRHIFYNTIELVKLSKRLK